MLGKRIFLCLLSAALVAFGCRKEDYMDEIEPEPVEEPSEQPDPEDPEAEDPEPEPKPEPAPQHSTKTGFAPLTLSAEFGIHDAEFMLTVVPEDSVNTIYYELNGAVATVKSSVFPENGIRINTSYLRSNYVLTPAVKVYDGGTYNFGYLGKGVAISLIEVDTAGTVIARKRGTYLLKDMLGDADIPVVCLSAPKDDWIGPTGYGGLYNTNPNSGIEDLKYRAQLEFYNPVNGESFNLNSQVKRGGNWTRSFACRTINVNFNKDEEGNKNPKVKNEIFPGHATLDGKGTLKGKINRFRLHSGGNMCFSAYISDPFIHQLCGNKTYASTTAYQPCLLFLNGEYWGLYSLREHYSDVYFEANYGVNKDEVLYVDKTYNGDSSAPTYQRYHYEVQEGSDADCLAALDELYALLGYDYTKAPTTLARNWNTAGWELTGPDSKYAKFCRMVDVKSLLDVILIQHYAANWDFMYNNLRMWRTKNVDPSNPYADGKWRFCLHDVDFGFEDSTADNNLLADDGTRGDGVWNKKGLSYFDYYMGTAYLNTGASRGYMKPYDYLLLWLPAHNPEFKKLAWERANVIAGIFESSKATAMWDEMLNQIEPYYPDRVKRWGLSGYSVDKWRSDASYRRWRIENRRDVFLAQVKKSFGL